MDNRVIGIMAHVDAGKTTLCEAMLFNAGMIKKQGRVDNKDAFLDTFQLEKSRGITIFSKQARIVCNNTCVTLIDTPGHTDFTAETERTLRILDYCILVVSSSQKLDSHTQALFVMLKKHNIPVFIFLNKTDMPQTDVASRMNELRKLTGADVVDFTDFISCEHGITADKGKKIKNEFYENIATADERMLDEYMETSLISDERIMTSIIRGQVIPCFKGSALKMEGIDIFFEGIMRLTRTFNYPKDSFGAVVYKITHENNVRLTHMKITGGSLHTKDILGDEKINEIRIYSGEKYENVLMADCGCVCAVAGLDNTYAGQCFGIEEQKKAYEQQYDEPVMTYSINFPDNVNIHEFMQKLRVLAEEEPKLNINYNEATHEITACVFGQVQMEVLKSIISERFGVNITFENGKVVYKETIKNAVYGAGHFEPLRHYAEVHLRVEPLERGSGIEFATECSVDELAINWQNLILTHLKEKEHKGVLTGSAITDVKFTLVAGKAHTKHTEGGDFREATYRAIRQALMKAENILLEPCYEYRITVPQEYLGRVMTDMDRMKATTILAQGDENMSVLTGRVSVEKINGYYMELAGYTKGAGRLELTPDGYMECADSERIINETGYDAEGDILNTASSVFCSHGSGFIVNWDEADGHMHIKIDENTGMVTEEDINSEQRLNRINKEIKEIAVTEEELKSIFEKTYKTQEKKNTRYAYKKTFTSMGNSYSSKEDYDKIRSKKVREARKIMLVDGYNVIFAWEDLNELAKVNLESARGSLMDEMCNLAAYEGYELILVYDAYKVKGNIGQLQKYNNISVVYTKEAQTADQYIEKMAVETGKTHDVTVATSDGLEQLIIRGAGCKLMSSRELYEHVEYVKKMIREQL